MSMTSRPSRSCLTRTERRNEGTCCSAAESRASDSCPSSRPSGAGSDVLRVQPLVRSLSRAPPAMRADDAKRHAEQPGANRSAHIERRPVAKEHQEISVTGPRCRLGGRHPLQRRENIVELSIERVEAAGLSRRKARRGMEQAQRAHREDTVRIRPLFESNRPRSRSCAPSRAQTSAANRTGAAVTSASAPAHPRRDDVRGPDRPGGAP